MDSCKFQNSYLHNWGYNHKHQVPLGVHIVRTPNLDTSVNSLLSSISPLKSFFQDLLVY
jgi:hypothetical protein